jgi:hypothetical protein
LEPHVLFDDLTVLRPTFLFILPQMAVKLYKRVHSIVSVPARLGEGVCVRVYVCQRDTVLPTT